MSEQTLPTLEQLDSQISQCLQRIGVLDAEFRKVAEPYNELGQRLQQIEAEKAELHKILANMQHTRDLVVKGSEVEGASDDDSNES